MAALPSRVILRVSEGSASVAGRGGESAIKTGFTPKALSQPLLPLSPPPKWFYPLFLANHTNYKLYNSKFVLPL